MQRYATRFNAVEINSSFYGPHQPKTYERWANSVPSAFRFSVKMPKRITHELGLQHCEAQLNEFLEQCLHLGQTLGCLLVQLPPSLLYEPVTAAAFFRVLRQRYLGAIALEPRHPSWCDAQALLQDLHIARVAADPPAFAEGNAPAGWQGLRYWRLHGSPRIYHSAYGPDRVQAYTRLLNQSVEEGVDSWCIFDNTASGHAIGDALHLLDPHAYPFSVR